MIFTSPDSILKRDTRPKDQGLKKDFGDTTVQDSSTPQQQRPPARSERCLVTDGTPISAPGMGPRLQYFDMGRVHHGRKLPPGEFASENQDFPGAFVFPYLSRRGQVRVRFGKLLAILTPPSYHPLPPDVSHLGRVFPSSPSLSLCCIPRLLYPPASKIGQIWSVQTG